MPAPKRIGILGGTFNPIHNAHIRLAKAAIRELGLDSIYFIPVYSPPHKQVLDRIIPAHRVNMVRLAIKSHPKFKLCLYEIKRKTLSYTIDTIRYMRKRFDGKTAFYVLIGSDSLQGLHLWKSLDLIKKMGKFVVARRPGVRIAKTFFNDKDILFLKDRMPDISSSLLRAKILKKRNISGLVPDKVAAYIDRRRPYGKRPCDK